MVFHGNQCLGKPVRRHLLRRRGGYLLFLALLDIIIGYSLINAPLSGHRSLLLPENGWAFTWIAVGSLCVVGAFMKKDRFAYVVAAGLFATWASLYMHLWLVQHVQRGWIAASLFYAFALSTVMISGWPEETVIMIPPSGEETEEDDK